jgi:hypothetical protein
MTYGGNLMADECKLSEKEQGHLDDGIAEFNRGRYWHAHEGWEDMWKSLKARDVDLRFILGIQGLIQVTALMFQYERQNPRGIINMWGKLTDKLGTPGSPMFENIWSVDIPKLLQNVLPFLNDAIREEPAWELNPNDVLI